MVESSRSPVLVDGVDRVVQIGRVDRDPTALAQEQRQLAEEVRGATSDLWSRRCADYLAAWMRRQGHALDL